MDAGGTYGRPRELGAGDARRTGRPGLSKEWAVSLDSPAGASEPASPRQVNTRGRDTVGPAPV